MTCQKGKQNSYVHVCCHSDRKLIKLILVNKKFNYLKWTALLTRFTIIARTAWSSFQTWIMRDCSEMGRTTFKSNTFYFVNMKNLYSSLVHYYILHAYLMC